jgi:hypothetical protein
MTDRPTVGFTHPWRLAAVVTGFWGTFAALLVVVL